MTSSGGVRTGTGTYVRLCEIASGGMGSVELAMRREGSFRRLFAIKRLLANFREDEDVRSMFLDEARIAGLLRHPNAVSVVDVGEDAGGPFLVMEYVEGLSLSSIVSRAQKGGGPIDVQVCARLIAQCAHGLHAAHELRGHDGTWLRLVHRDVSPQNILVGYDGIVRLTDFGIAKAAGRATRTSTGLLKGKLAYMAPEQLRFEEPDRRSDLFALGVVCFELVVGARLFKGESPRDAARKILNEDAPDVRTLRPDAPEALAVLLSEMLSREPDGRPAEAANVAQRLEDVAAALAAREGVKDVGAFMRGRFDDAREESARRIAETIAGAESEPNVRLEPDDPPTAPDLHLAPSDTVPSGAAPQALAVPPTLTTPIARARRTAIAIVTIVAIAAGGAIAWLGDGEDATERPTIAAPSTPVAGHGPEADPGGPAIDTPDDTGPPGAGVAPAAGAQPALGANRAETEADRDATRARGRESGPRERAGTRRRTKRWDWE